MTYDALNPEDIRQLHQIALERYGGFPGENEPGMIDYMAGKLFMTNFGQESYPGLFMEAAVYLEGFATYQYFCDGNKRTAYLTAATFIELNAYSLIVEDHELYEMCMAVATRKVSLGELAVWIEKNAQPHK